MAMPNFKAKDIVALVTIIGIVVLKLNGHNGGLDAIMALILGYYFVKRENGEDSGK